LGTDADGATICEAFAINAAGAAVGFARKYDDSGTYYGTRAVRWDGAGTSATELGNLGTRAGGSTSGAAYAINDAGVAIGLAVAYDEVGILLGPKAVYWDLDGVAVDLNTLIDPASGWTLTRATAISNTGWIGGEAVFDPDGAGGQEPYERLFLLQVTATAVPEPATIVLSGVAFFIAATHRRVWRNV
jgi:hypothetical protein